MLRLSFIAFACALAGVVLSARILNVSRLHDYPVVYGINQWSPSTLPPGAAASAFPYTYNPSFIEPTVRFSKHKEGCLLARVQNYSSASAPGPVPSKTPGVKSPGPSKLALTCLTDGVFSNITADSVVFEPSTPEEALGTEDPRVALVNGTTYLLFYTAVQVHPTSGDLVVRLSLASTETPDVKSSWKRHGALFPDVDGNQFTKSGALLVQDAGLPSYLIFGDCTLYQGLQVAVASADFLHYTVLEDFFLIQKRPQMFDSGLVESGPAPLRLADGNWLFVYNGAQHLQGVANELFYSPGWVVLNGSNPLQVLDRADTPLLMPTYSWETSGLVPYVVFVEALHYVDAASNTFVAYYGAADTNIGAFTFTVETDPHRGRGTFRAVLQAEASQAVEDVNDDSTAL